MTFYNGTKEQLRNVDSLVVSKDLCCGCGVCALACPSQIIKMEFRQKLGEYRATVVSDDCLNCGKCYSVCPDNYTLYKKIGERVHADLKKLPGIKDSYLSTYVGYTSNEKERLESSSGGLLTSLLSLMINQRIVDGVIATKKIANTFNKPLFEASICYSAKEIKNSKGSKYYPIEFSGVLKEVRENKHKKYAVVGLPCSIFAIRKLMHVTRSFDNIKFMFGLVCGHNKSALFTESLILEENISKDEKLLVNFRDKTGINAANNSNFKITTRSRTIRKSSQESSFGRLWTSYMFALNKCLYCPDFTNQFADVSFMDAWLPEYEKDPRGTSMIIVRNEFIDNIFKELFSQKSISLKTITPDNILKAQGRAVYFKSTLLRNRLAIRKYFMRNSNMYPFSDITIKDLLNFKIFYKNVVIIINMKISKILFTFGLFPKYVHTNTILLFTNPIRTVNLVFRKFNHFIRGR